MAKQEEVLQKVNDYCNEKSYTLDDSFRTKFSEKYATANTEADLTDENVLNSIKFNLDTAFSAASKGIEAKEKTWKEKEAEYLKKIESSKDGIKADTDTGKEESSAVIPTEIKDKLEQLEKLQLDGQKREKRANVLKLAQKNVREDLHNDLEVVLDIMKMDYSKDEKDLANDLNENFTKLYKGKIGTVKPASPEASKKKIEEMLANLPKVNVY